jgi:hypothetical protein
MARPERTASVLARLIRLDATDSGCSAYGVSVNVLGHVYQLGQGSSCLYG